MCTITQNNLFNIFFHTFVYEFLFTYFTGFTYFNTTFFFRQAEELIPSMFRFLVLLSYERHHSKSIIGVPKIIQLCDGLMASGQPPLSHCKLFVT